MVYIVETKFAIGIFLSQFGVKRNEYLQKACITTIENYSEALKIVLKKSEGAIRKDEFVPNRFYQIKSKKIYSVIWDYRGVGFALTDNLAKFESDNGLNIIYLRYRNNLEYQEAVAMVTSLGAETGKGKIFQTRCPVPNVWYGRKQ